MNRCGLLCRCVLEKPNSTQREMAQILNLSLGTVNHLIKECISLGYLKAAPGANSYALSDRGRELLESFCVDGALILAAGFGSRFVPLTFETPKGLLEVFHERMIERQIRQLQQAGIKNITVAVGYLKEKFEYLIDKYGVTLLYNPEYACKNTLATVYHSRHLLKGKNVYVLSSDNWLRENMFHKYECGSWYSSVYKEGETSEWRLDFNKKGVISSVTVGGRDCFVMYGPAFLSSDFSERFLPVLEAYYQMPGTEQLYWEHVLMEMLSGEAEKRIRLCGPASPGLDFRIEMSVNRQAADQVYEFENLEELRSFDERYQSHSDNRAMELVAGVFFVPESEIREIRCLKAGMTNKSFLFQVKNQPYICRIPGPGTELLINRKEEKSVYDTVAALGITEQVIYFDGDTGYKITKFYEGAYNADASDWKETAACMEVTRKLHDSHLKVDHSFNIRERVSFYEKLCRNCNSILFEDYEKVRGWMEVLMDRLDKLDRPVTLSHIDSVPDNFLFLPDGDIKLIDWEYSGMCDPLIDPAMWSIYSLYNEEDCDRLIKTYLQREPDSDEMTVYYSYIALGGFLWSLWAVYKSALGEEFGEYTILMYRYAKRYYRKLYDKM